MNLVKSHAFGNDFLLLHRRELQGQRGLAALARSLCDRHRGLGADGLIVYDTDEGRASMRLLNADGSRSEISGNGLRCLAASIARDTGLAPGATIDIDTEAGAKRLELLGETAGRFTFRAAMGQPEQVTRVRISVNGVPVDAVTLRVGNPQCVVLGEVTEARLHSLAAALAVHPHFPEGTNVELAAVETPQQVRILIWERGVGPTEASGTGACAAAVAAIEYGGAARDVEVESPGGTQRVEWLEDGLYLTGWAEVVAEARWLPAGKPAV
jgi:diaminopimelate epimerase